MDCKNIINAKKKDVSYTISIHYLAFAIFEILTYRHCIVHRSEEWVGTSLRNFQKGWGEYRNSEVLVILYVVFVAT